MAGTSLTPILHYTCPESGLEDPQALCEALRLALSEIAPGHELRRADSMPGTAPESGSLNLSLQLDRVDAHGLTAHLLWQGSTDSAPVTGPEATIGVMDAELAPRMYPRFTRALLKISALPL